jgi:signal transduction histidine kinase
VTRRAEALRAGAARLVHVFRTTTFKLTLVYLAVFAIAVLFLLGYFAWNTNRLITEQIQETVDAEITGLTEQYRLSGIRRLVFVIESRAQRPGSNLYLVTTFTGEGLAGNVASLTPGVLDRAGWVETAYRRLDEGEGATHRALARVEQLPGGFRLLVGRDLDEREHLLDILFSALRWLIGLLVVLGLAGGLFVTRRVLRRVDAMTGTTQTIMAGDLGGRLPIAGTGDEIDRLAGNLNAMLERIEVLMRGLKEVSDNIAHDLKTPLTRLRNRAEEALRSAKSEHDYREALEATIDESEGLIRTFDALLMIARAESGQGGEEMADVDAAEIVRGVADLYEPVADERGLGIAIDAPRPALVRGNRELISQALANLVDNAIKYADPTLAPVNGVSAPIEITARGEGDHILLAVADHGPGIPPGDRGRVVDRFVRLEGSRSQPGSGLGLSLASAVAHLHGGELRLEDNKPGLRAVLALPRGGAQAPAIP